MDRVCKKCSIKKECYGKLNGARPVCAAINRVALAKKVEDIISDIPVFDAVAILESVKFSIAPKSK